MRKQLLILFLCFLVSAQFLFYLPEVKAAASWYNSSWGFRKAHNITASSGAGEDYQIRITANYSSGSDSGETIYLDSKCKTDFSDLRFTDDDGTTLLDYWQDTDFYTESVSSEFWVEVADSLSSSTVTIYVYYNNSGASSTSNFTATFLEGDTFTRADNATVGVTEILGGTWTERNEAGYQISSNELLLTPSTQSGHVAPNYNGLYDFAMDFILYVPSGSTTDWAGANVRKSADSHFWGSSGILIYFRDNGNIEVAGGSPSGDTSGTFTAGQDNFISIRANGTRILTYVNDGLELNFTDSDETGGYLDFSSYSLPGSIRDSFRVRRFVDPEPSHSTWGSEEIEAVPPEYGTISYNSTLSGSVVNFSIGWTDDVNMSGYIFGWNNTGSFTNDTWSQITPETNDTTVNTIKTLTAAIGSVISFQEWANDTADSWNNTGLQSFTVTAVYLTFYKNDAGEFRVNSTNRANGTELGFGLNNVLEFAGLPENSSYRFINFNWDGGANSSASNPYLFTVSSSSNNTVWLVFEEVSDAVAGDPIFFAMGISFIFIPLSIFILYALRRR